MGKTLLFHAKSVVTMDRNQPRASHVAVRDGRVLAVGGPNCADPWGGAEAHVDLSDTVLMPGFVEGHAHMMAGAMWDYAYCGYHDRIDPQGQMHKGMTQIDQVIARLSEFEATLAPEQPLIGWGFDPIFLTSERLSRHHLDQVSITRPIVIIFSNFHLLCGNSAALALAGYDVATNVEGVIKGSDGQPTGELQEMAAMFPVMRRTGIDFRDLTQTDAALRSYGEVCKRVGVTTVTDLFATLGDEDVARLAAATARSDFPVRLVPALGAMGGTPAEIAAQARAMRDRSTEKLRLGAVKLMTDGSIQGWTARVRAPGYVGGQPNGLWNTAPDQIFQLCEEMQRQGLQMHIHVNGDEAAEVTLDALEAAARKHPWPGARHVLQHCQMMDAALFRRAAELGVACNIFANHLWYFGDQHAALTIGPDRAQSMDAVRDCLDAGVITAIHSDAPVTPMGPLFTAWCAVNRRTMSGQTLGRAQCISVEEALYAITLGAAQTLKMDAEIGSIQTGKRADFVLLGADPTAVDPDALKDITVLGTVLGGEVHRL
ncbi:amidohydrolase [Ruegeria lacuscaerulensis]|uniref:amidohydrolase n=1 Tax=Ruegeria lacuscaerulensis TaxID=55218 RepID=UPI00147E5054|nr:amidohydrolase [Ruegeria lacuscaerulensis]